MQEKHEVVVIGAGFFGCMLALHVSAHGRQVLILERSARAMQRASYNNQARVHNGYHYPRSLRTALSSRANLPRFVAQFPECVDRSFEPYYAVARAFSKVSAKQFRSFFEQIGAPIEPAPAHLRRYFQADMIEDIFRVAENAFDASKLAELLLRRLTASNVEVRYNSEVRKLEASPVGDGSLAVNYQTEGSPQQLHAEQVFNCTYANLNQVLAESGLPLIPLKHELAELALVEPPAELFQVGVTVMCGPFFSLMPFPARGLHSLSHVRYTPHRAWHDGAGDYVSAYERMESDPRPTNYPFMIRDASRYMPMVAECKYVESLWETKTVLPRSEQDDGRPILLKTHYGLPNFHCVLGAKIDNVYDLLDQVGTLLVPERKCA